MFKNQRQVQRVNVNLPIQLNFGTQISLMGSLRDITLKSAFVNIRSSAIHMTTHDELTFTIEQHAENPQGPIQGTARISRVDPGDGIAIYFTKMDESSLSHLQQLVGNK